MEGEKKVMKIGEDQVFVMDSIAYLDKEIGNQDIVVCASHGGVSAGAFVLKSSFPRAVIFNDAGLGKENAGIAALDMMEKKNVAAATVSHNTARIGDGLDTWENGVISHVNKTASSNRGRIGMTVKEFCEALFSE